MLCLYVSLLMHDRMNAKRKGYDYGYYLKDLTFWSKKPRVPHSSLSRNSSLAVSDYPVVHPFFQKLQGHGPTEENDIMELSKIKTLAQFFLSSVS